MRKGAVQSIKKHLCLAYAGFHSSEFAISVILVEVFIPGPINHWCQDKFQHKKTKSVKRHLSNWTSFLLQPLKNK